MIDIEKFLSLPLNNGYERRGCLKYNFMLSSEYAMNPKGNWYANHSHIGVIKVAGGPVDYGNPFNLTEGVVKLLNEFELILLTHYPHKSSPVDIAFNEHLKREFVASLGNL